MNKKNHLIFAALLAGGICADAAPLADWPRVTSAVKADPAIEAQVKHIVAGMTLRQKVGQMTQAEIASVTPDEVRSYYIGSVLNGGGSWPGKKKLATASDWVALADQFYDASMATDMQVKVPVVWGIDAVHGNNNVRGATLYPHNIGLGAAHDKRLAGRMGQAVAHAVRATGINWVFAPTLAVVRDVRWGRTYESFSNDPKLVSDYAAEYVRGMQGGLNGEGDVIATAKHFIGDGATDQGRDQGNSLVSRADMINFYGRPYYAALAAGAQTVMASYNSWNDQAGGTDYAKLHGSRALLTDALKTKMGFDGFVVSDWDGVAQVAGCAKDACAQAINAGIDMVMVPTDWKAFIANTIAQVESGAIPMARIDDAVTRIVRVKLRAGLFGKKPSASRYAGKQEALQNRPLARELVQKSLVLLKNDTGALPLAPGKRILVVGEGADSLVLQSGGWSLTWQGNGTENADFTVSDSILAGIVAANGKDKVTYSIDGMGVDVSAFDTVIAVLAESPYAEGAGDVGPTGNLRHTSRYPQELAMLERVAGKGKPVVTVRQFRRRLAAGHGRQGHCRRAVQGRQIVCGHAAVRLAEVRVPDHSRQGRDRRAAVRHGLRSEIGRALARRPARHNCAGRWLCRYQRAAGVCARRPCAFPAGDCERQPAREPGPRPGQCRGTARHQGGKRRTGAEPGWQKGDMDGPGAHRSTGGGATRAARLHHGKQRVALRCARACRTGRQGHARLWRGHGGRHAPVDRHGRQEGANRERAAGVLQGCRHRRHAVQRRGQRPVCRGLRQCRSGGRTGGGMQRLAIILLCASSAATAAAALR
jgi:beta-glucosidase-like glycosyl hydrolase